MLEIEVGSKLLITNVEEIIGGFNYYENGLIVEVVEIHPVSDIGCGEYALVTTTIDGVSLYTIYSFELKYVALYLGGDIN